MIIENKSKQLSEILTLVSGKILVKEEESDTITESGLELGKSGIVQKSIGRVLMVSSAKYSISDRVAYSKFGGVEVEILGEKYKVLQENEMFFKINSDGSFEACNGWIIVSRNQGIKESEGGLLIARSSQKERTSGMVVSKSADVIADFGVDTEVVFSKHAGFDAEILGKNYVILDIHEIFMYITIVPK